MTSVGPPDPYELPLRDRVRHGARRGGLFGVYLFVVVWLKAALTQRSDRVLDAPVTAAAALIAGCAVAGVILLAGRRRVHSTLGAIGLAIACVFPVLVAFAITVRPLSIGALPFVVAASIMLGAIAGTMLWKGWHR